MTPTDVKALKPGQRFLAELVFDDICTDGQSVAVLLPTHTRRIWLPASAIHSVLPDPIKVGDSVRKIGLIQVGETVMVRGEYAWVLFIETADAVRVPLSNLERI